MSPVRSVLLAPLLLAALLAAAPASAAPVVFQATLSGANEAPPNASTGSGTVTVTYDPATFLMTLAMDFTGLSGTTSAAHIHCCVAGPGINVGVASTTPSFPGFPNGVSAGVYANTFNLDAPASFNPAFIVANGGTVPGARAALLDGMGRRGAYFNLHTSVFPGGELRADLAEVPIFASSFD
jgi:hypothetical protein